MEIVEGGGEIRVTDMPQKGWFEIALDGRRVGLADYRVQDGAMVLPHTEIDPSVGGRGLGSHLVREVLAAARQRGLKVVPGCSFVAAYLRDHPEELDLVDDTWRARLAG